MGVCPLQARPGELLVRYQTRQVKDMSPRGVAIPAVREQLFDATDRILGRDGPNAVTTRAITDEAGCAKGILHNHFTDLDGFLAAYALDRINSLTERAQTLPALVGLHTVVDNLVTVIVDLFGSGAAAVASLMTARPALLAQLGATGAGIDPVFDDVERVFAAYLEAEKQLGRIPAEADAEMLAFTLLGSSHHLFFTQAMEPIDPQRVRRIAASLVPGQTGPHKPTKRI
jgi:AcrR family transcriptional regulator